MTFETLNTQDKNNAQLAALQNLRNNAASVNSITDQLKAQYDQYAAQQKQSLGIVTSSANTAGTNATNITNTFNPKATTNGYSVTGTAYDPNQTAPNYSLQLSANNDWKKNLGLQ